MQESDNMDEEFEEGEQEDIMDAMFGERASV